MYITYWYTYNVHVVVYMYIVQCTWDNCGRCLQTCGIYYLRTKSVKCTCTCTCVYTWTRKYSFWRTQCLTLIADQLAHTTGHIWIHLSLGRRDITRGINEKLNCIHVVRNQKNLRLFVHKGTRLRPLYYTHVFACTHIHVQCVCTYIHVHVNTVAHLACLY